ncbi:hypothetical protein Tco_1329311 [Tanacetum coccineum]
MRQTEAWKTPITLRVKTLGECWFVNAKFPEAIREQKVGKPRCRMAPCASMAMSWLPVMAICEHVIIARNPKNQNTLFIRVPTKCTKDREEVILGGPTRKTDIEPLMLTRKLLDRVQRRKRTCAHIKLPVIHIVTFYNGGGLPDNEEKHYWESLNDNKRVDLEWEELSFNDWDDMEVKDGEDPEESGEDKANAILRVVLEKLEEAWFNGTSEDEDDLEGIIDYLEPKSYDRFINLDDKAYN